MAARAVGEQLAAITLGLCALLSPWREAKAEQRSAGAMPYQLEVGPTLAYVARRVEPNDDRSTYAPTLAPGLNMRLSLFPWLRVSGRYQRALHDVRLPPGSLGTGARELTADQIHMTTLDAAVHPVLNVAPTLHLMGTIGVGWASVVAPQIALDPSSDPPGPTLRLRHGVFLEAPLGLGLVWDVIPRWLTLSYEALYAPSFSSSGDVFSKDSYIDARGLPSVVGPLPTLGASYYHLATVALAL